MNRREFNLLLCSFIFSSCISLPSLSDLYDPKKLFSKGKLKVGFSKKEIKLNKKTILTPTPPFILNYSHDINDPLYSKAIVLDNGYNRLAITSSDIMIITDDLRKNVLSKLKKKGSSLEEILITATHTHSGPGCYWDNWLAETIMLGPYNPFMFEKISNSIVNSIIEAEQNLYDSKVGFSQKQIFNLSKNRRKKNGIIDPDFTLYSFENSYNKIFLISFGAHPVKMMRKGLISADFPGALSYYLGKENIDLIFLNGALGRTNANYPKSDSSNPYISCKLFAKKLINHAKELYSKLKFKNEIILNSITTNFITPEVNLGLVPDFLSYPLFSLSYPLSWLIDLLWVPDSVDLQSIQIDKSLIYGLPGDFGQIYSKELKNLTKSYGYFPISAVSHANGWTGYLVKSDEFNYETILTFFKDLPDQYIEEFKKHLSFKQKYSSSLMKQLVKYLK